MNRKVPGLIFNDLRNLRFMVPMHARSERGLPMNPHPKAALKTTALQTLRAAGSRSNCAPAFGVRSLQHRFSCAGSVSLVQGFNARKGFRGILTPALSPSAGERENRSASQHICSQFCHLSQGFLSNSKAPWDAAETSPRQPFRPRYLRHMIATTETSQKVLTEEELQSLPDDGFNLPNRRSPAGFAVRDTRNRSACPPAPALCLTRC